MNSSQSYIAQISISIKSIDNAHVTQHSQTYTHEQKMTNHHHHHEGRLLYKRDKLLHVQT